MRKILTALLLISETAIGQIKPQVAFTIAEKDIIPEGIAYDASEKAFYLGSIRSQKIIKINEKGKATDFVRSGQDGIQQVLGMKADASGRLWACNNSAEYDTTRKISNVHVYELKSGKLWKQFNLDENKKHLFNDLHITASGDAYVTDSDGGAIYRIKKENDKIEEFIAPGSFRYPNGITATADDKKLFVSTSQGIVIIDIETRSIKPLRHHKFLVIGIDGLYRQGNALIGVQNVFFPESVMKLTLSESSDSITGIEFLASDDPKFDLPTTGVIVGNEFYFIANSQLLQIRGTRGEIKNREKLNDTVIMKITLN